MINEGSDLSKTSSKILLQIDPQDLLNYFQLKQLYPDEEEFAVPYLFKVFELALENREVYVVEAEPNELHLKILMDNFEKETNKGIKIKSETLLSNGIAKSTVIRMRSEKYIRAWYPHSNSLKNRIIRGLIAKRIETILLNRFENKLSAISVGLIKPKSVGADTILTPFTLDRIGSRLKTLDFGNLRGSNQLNDSDIGFVLGTYVTNIEELLKNYQKVYHRKPSSQTSKDPDGGYHYTDESLENYRQLNDDSEMYQAIHRFRPAIKPKEIFVFGKVPERIHEEFRVLELMIETEFEGKEKVEVMRLAEWKNFDEIVKEKIVDEGLYQRDLVDGVYHEFAGNKEVIRQKIKKFVEEHKDVYEIIQKPVFGNKTHPFIKKRRTS